MKQGYFLLLPDLLQGLRNKASDVPLCHGNNVNFSLLNFKFWLVLQASKEIFCIWEKDV